MPRNSHTQNPDVDTVVRLPAVDPAVSGTFRAPDTEQIETAAENAARRVAPLWPLESFVAVNPFVGLTAERFDDAALKLARMGQGELLMPGTFYAERIAGGDVSADDLDEAAALTRYAGWDGDPDASVAALRGVPDLTGEAAPTFASTLGAGPDIDYAALVREQIATFAAAYFDKGQAHWPSPWQGDGVYAAWRAETLLDPTPALYGLANWRRTARSLPVAAGDMLAVAVAELDISGDDVEPYFDRLLADIAGWAGHARYLDWHAERPGGVVELLAIRAGWDILLHRLFGDSDVHRDWLMRRREFSRPPSEAARRSVTLRYFAHTAWEIARRRIVLRASAGGRVRLPSRSVVTPLREPRPAVQAVFCIDVRSERLRRVLEEMDSGIATLGFAGFFGVPLEVLSLDEAESSAQCPVLLTPQFRVRESSGAGDREHGVAALRRDRHVTAAWQSFHSAAVSSFAYVEALGLGYVYRLIRDSFGSAHGHAPAVEAPAHIEDRGLEDSAIGIGLDDRVALAKAALCGMSLTSNFADIVILVGHGSSSANNPYATRLNCGACGGHSGDTNARVAARILNDPAVRDRLDAQGISVPMRTRFVAGLHDTCTDEVRLFDTDTLEPPYGPTLARIENAFALAARTVRRARASDHGITDEVSDAALRRRSVDWSEVRPEWGLAGCHAFIAAPRARTRQSDLHGRAFLHSYDWKDDENYDVLELIMTAPLVVASWISLQYYASSVDNERFGSGDKTLHNVVGGLGVIEGTGGDLRVGLPSQSVHDGRRWLHEPLRLNALIAAPAEAISGILMKHASVRELVDNAWVHLYALTDDGCARRYLGDLAWSEPVAGPGWHLAPSADERDARRAG